MIGNHRPTPHRQQRFARRCGDGNRVVVRTASWTSSKVDVSQRLVELIERHWMRRRQVGWRETDDHARGTDRLVSIGTKIMAPTIGGGRAYESISRLPESGGLLATHRDADDVWPVGLNKDCATIPIEDE